MSDTFADPTLCVIGVALLQNMSPYERRQAELERRRELLREA
jgi:hypothetical protein